MIQPRNAAGELGNLQQVAFQLDGPFFSVDRIIDSRSSAALVWGGFIITTRGVALQQAPGIADVAHPAALSVPASGVAQQLTLALVTTHLLLPAAAAAMLQQASPLMPGMLRRI
jgi:hypothetical protein